MPCRRGRRAAGAGAGARRRSARRRCIGARRCGGWSSAMVARCAQLAFSSAIERTPGHRHEVATAEAPDLAFDPAFLMRALDAGEAEERVEAVVAAQGDEAVGLVAVPALQHPDDGRLQVVVADRGPGRRRSARRPGRGRRRRPLGPGWRRRGGSPCPRPTAA